VLFGYLKPFRSKVLFALLITFLVTFLSLLPPLIMRYLVDRVFTAGNWNLLVPMVVIIVVTPVLIAVVSFVNINTIMYVGRRAIESVRIEMYQRALNLNMAFYSRTSSGTVVARLMDDVNRVQRLLTRETVTIVVDAIVFLFSIGFILWISPWLGATMIFFVLLLILAYRFFSKRIKKATQIHRSLYDGIATRLSETVAGVRQVRIYNQEARESDVFLDQTARSLDTELASQMGSVSLGTSCHAVVGYGSTVIVGLGAYFILRGYMTYGDLLAIDSYIWMAMGPALHLTGMIGELNETVVSLCRITEILEAETSIISREGAPRILSRPGEIEFRDVTFSYEPDVPLYEGLSLKIPVDKTVAIVGPTGCGKTTLTSLLMRYWDVQEGAVLVNGVDVREMDLGSLRGLFGVVSQDSVVFEGTIAENIAYGRPRASREDIEAAARAAEVMDFADKLPDGLDAVLGTKGVKLSLGERQRLSIARAILKEPAILIMDEATAALDSHSESLIQKALKSILKGRTSVVIAHRLTTITSADMIVVMDNGRIVDAGLHGELLAKDGLYTRLYNELLMENKEGVQ
jgi:subfamily B ATP-binding cassette protein MsbA